MISDQHKGAAQALLARAGLPVPEGCVFAPSDIQGATEYAHRLGFPVVTKPVSGTGGAGVTTGIRSDKELAAGFEAIKSTRFARADVLVQRHVPGNLYRIMVADGEVIAALLRVPPSVTGDGTRSVAELIIEKNTYRSDNPRLRKGLLHSEEVAEYLARDGICLDQVPPIGQRVQVGDEPYLNMGGDSIDVLDELHPSVAKVAIAAVAAVPELRFCGVDILLEDHREAAERQEVGICELNACPELITPQFPLFGRPRLVARTLLLMAASRCSLSVSTEPAEELDCMIKVHGLLGTDYVDWYARRAREFDLRGWIEYGDGAAVVSAVSGGAVPVSALASLAIAGPHGSEPTIVSTEHIAPVQPDGFGVQQVAMTARKA
jgi:D-alanine-D-alanine ligase-like ATP-grasp enzyme